MTILTHDTHRHTASDHFGAVIRAITTGARKLAGLYVAHRQHSAQRLLIASLSDHQLRDLGISRDQVITRSFADPHAS